MEECVNLGKTLRNLLASVIVTKASGPNVSCDFQILIYHNNTQINHFKSSYSVISGFCGKAPTMKSCNPPGFLRRKTSADQTLISFVYHKRTFTVDHVV